MVQSHSRNIQITAHTTHHILLCCSFFLIPLRIFLLLDNTQLIQVQVFQLELYIYGDRVEQNKVL